MAFTASLGSPSSLGALNGIIGGCSNFSTVFEKIVGTSVFYLSIPFSEHNIYSPRDVIAITPLGDVVSILWGLSGNDVFIDSNVDLNGHTIKIFQ